MPLTDKKEDDMARVFEPTLALTLAVAASGGLKMPPRFHVAPVVTSPTDLGRGVQCGEIAASVTASIERPVASASSLTHPTTATVATRGTPTGCTSAPVNSAARKATGDPARREERRELEPVSCVDLR